MYELWCSHLIARPVVVGYSANEESMYKDQGPVPDRGEEVVKREEKKHHPGHLQQGGGDRNHSGAEN
jgi:hypothetical protein